MGQKQTLVRGSEMSASPLRADVLSVEHGCPQSAKVEII